MTLPLAAYEVATYRRWGTARATTFRGHAYAIAFGIAAAVFLIWGLA